MAKSQRPTMSEIAEELNLSRVTVSSVLNDQARSRGISSSTAKRVLEYVSKRGYVPSRSALQLRGGNQQKVGLIHCGRHYAHLNQAFNAIADALAEAPQKLELSVVRRDSLVAGIRELIARGVSTLIWLQRSEHAVEFADPSVLNYLSNVRCIIYNYQFEKPQWTEDLVKRGYFLVGVNRLEALKQFAQRVRELGHDTIAIPEVARKWAVRRGAVYEAAGLKVIYSAPNIPEHAPRHNYARQIAGNLLDARRQGATCACFCDDVTAGLVMYTLREIGLNIPEDMSVTGYNGDPLGAAFAVPLTTVVMPVAGMVGRVLEIIDGQSDQKENLFDLQLVERESLGCRLANSPQLDQMLRHVEARLPQERLNVPSYIAGLEALPSL